MCMATPLSWNGGVAPYLLRIYTSVAINTQQQLEVFPIFLIPPLFGMFLSLQYAPSLRRFIHISHPLRYSIHLLLKDSTGVIALSTDFTVTSGKFDKCTFSATTTRAQAARFVLPPQFDGSDSVYYDSIRTDSQSPDLSPERTVTVLSRA